MTPNFSAPACMHPSPVAALALRPSGACQTYQSPPQPPGPILFGTEFANFIKPMTQVACRQYVRPYQSLQSCRDFAMCLSPVPSCKSMKRNKLGISRKFRAEQYCTGPPEGWAAVGF